MGGGGGGSQWEKADCSCCPLILLPQLFSGPLRTRDGQTCLPSGARKDFLAEERTQGLQGDADLPPLHLTLTSTPTQTWDRPTKLLHICSVSTSSVSG